MSESVETDETIEVSGEGLTVRKSYSGEEFPVPVIRFDIESDHDSPVSFRLSESIPDSFPMENVGFHPEYHSDAWTAFQDHHVEFSGTVEPEETLTTVYGVRLEDEGDVGAFLTEPAVEDVSVGDGPGESADGDAEGGVLSEDRNQVVKDMLTGEADTVPGLEDEPEEESPTEAAEDLELDLGNVDTEPVEFDGEPGEDDVPDIDLGFDEAEITEPEEDEESAENPPKIELDLGAAEERSEPEDGPEEATGPDEPEGTIEPEIPEERTEIGGDESEIDEGGLEAGGDESEIAEGESEIGEDEPEVDEDEPGDGTETPEGNGDAGDGSSTPTPVEGSVVTRFVEELREGEHTEADLAFLRSELGGEPTASDGARIDHLQTRVEEVAAYASAIERFLDENGTGEQLIEEFKDELAGFDDRLGGMDGRIDDTESIVGSLDEDVDELSERTGAVESDFETTDDRLDAVDEELDSVRAEIESLESSVERLETELGELEEDVVDVVEWREQLGSMFSS